MQPWYEFLEDIKSAREELGDPDVVWYRGHSSDKYSLVPSLHRDPESLSKEQQLFEEFRRSATSILGEQINDWDTLIDMQHYGVPTRLLDWTEVLGVAVAFAVLDRHEADQNAAVFVLDPSKLNSYSGIQGVKEIPSDGFAYKAVYWQNQPFAAQFPIAIAPPYRNDRMKAQKGTSTVHGSDSSPVETVCSSAIVKVSLPEVALTGAKEFLEHADYNPLTIYPDIVGIAGHIRKKFLS